MSVYGEIEYSYNENRFHLKKNGEDVDLPEILFKYYALSDTSVDAFENMYVYATHPMQFSDNKDCSSSMIVFDDYVNVKALFSTVLNISKDNFESNKDFYLQKANESYYELLYRMWGVLSLTKSDSNEYLWKAYAKDSGFCVAFDYEKFSFKNDVFPVSYEDKLPEFKTSNNDFPSSVLAQCLIKTKDFEKEQEWRMMISSPEGEDMESFGKWRNNPKGHYHNRKFYYPVNNLSSI